MPDMAWSVPRGRSQEFFALPASSLSWQISSQGPRQGADMHGRSGASCQTAVAATASTRPSGITCIRADTNRAMDEQTAGATGLVAMGRVGSTAGSADRRTWVLGFSTSSC